MRGKFIVLYGINNLGKTLQAKKVVEYLQTRKFSTEYIKYPVYDSKSGRLINDYLRNGLVMSKKDINILQIINKFEFSDKLEKLLIKNCVVAEDYILTGIAWGMAAGLPKKWFSQFYDSLRQPDVAVVLDGERFLESREKTHKFESDDILTQRSRKAHLKLAKLYGYPVINANQPIEKVTQDIVNYLEKVLK